MESSKEIAKVIEHARLIATAAHYGQFRRDGVTPYITHPEAVAAAVPDELKPAAWLHDVIEDTWFTYLDLVRCGLFRDKSRYGLYDQVYWLTKKPGQDYRKYIEDICSRKDLATIKLADMRHNLSCNPSQRSIEKSKWALPMLIAAANEPITQVTHQG